MAEAVSGTVPNPAKLPHEDIRVLLRAGKNEAAVARLCAILVVQPDDLVAKELLFDAFFQRRICSRPSCWPRSWPRGSHSSRACART